MRQQIDLTACDTEPIHLIGAIQPHGALVPQILDPRSANSIFHDPAFTGLLVEGKAHFGLAVP